eukprot:10761604-Karenia_brevis.AAC.1
MLKTIGLSLSPKRGNCKFLCFGAVVQPPAEFLVNNVSVVHVLEMRVLGAMFSEDVTAEDDLNHR